MPKPKKQLKSKCTSSGLFDRVVVILEQARSHVVRSVNHYMVLAYWKIGKEIVEQEQQGAVRAEYGKHVIDELSCYLNERYGQGFSTTNLRYFRQFFLSYRNRKQIDNLSDGLDEKRHPLGGELGGSPSPGKMCHPMGDEFQSQGFHPDLGWSHQPTTVFRRRGHRGAKRTEYPLSNKEHPMSKGVSGPDISCHITLIKGVWHGYNNQV